MAGPIRKPPRKPRPGQPSEEDLLLWRYALRDARPLRRRDAPPSPESEAESEAAAAAPAATRGGLRGSAAPAATSSGGGNPPPAPVRPARLPPARLAPAPLPPAPAAPALDHGAVAALDKRKAQRLRRGRLPIEARIDLHGMTQAEAHGALAGFVRRSAAAGRRCVLVITGKGGPGAEGGVLRRQVPLWLNQADLRDKILAFDYAQPEHGGQGALYVLLKRRREEGGA